ncbi:ROK family protein [Actinokineospora sp. 24-640]
MRAIGVDVGGTSVRAGVVDENGTVLDTARGSTPQDEAALEEVICAVVHGLASRHEVGAVGLAVAGFVAADRRTVLFAPHLSWRDAPVADRVSERLGLPVVLEHDANAAAVGEHRHGALRGSRVGLLIALGTGIGGALVLDGTVFRGAHGVAPELGHLPVVPNGRPCDCGKSGCWERYCSGTALAATALDLLADAPTSILSAGTLTGRKVAAAAREGDPVAQRAVADLAHWLGEGLAIAADVYDPETIVLGGGVCDSADLFLDDARTHYARTLTGAGHRPLAHIHPAQLGDDAGLVGAATLAAELHVAG